MQAHAWSLLDNMASHCPDGFIHLNLGTVQLKDSNGRKTLSCSPGGGKCRADLNQLPDDYKQILELKTDDFIQKLASLRLGTFPIGTQRGNNGMPNQVLDLNVPNQIDDSRKRKELNAHSFEYDEHVFLYSCPKVSIQHFQIESAG